MMALTRGRQPPPAPGQRPGRDCGDPAELGSFEALWRAFERQLADQVEVLVRAVEGKDLAHRDLLPAPYVSALMDDCVERATDITAGGARYDFTSIDARGLATLTDSLLALRHFVYQRRELSLTAYVRMVLRDFRGQEAMRQRILREAPKYGSGQAEADAPALRVLEALSRQAARHRNVRGGRFRVCYYSYGNHVLDGLLIGATPDGRRRGQPISNGVSPSDIIDPPAVALDALGAVARFPPQQCSSGVSLNLRFHPSCLASDNGVQSFAAMIRAYFREGGMHLQPNIVSTETLRAAQRDPDRHRGLVVKVAGYSAYFTDLGRSVQEDIIQRAELGAS